MPNRNRVLALTEYMKPPLLLARLGLRAGEVVALSYIARLRGSSIGWVKRPRSQRDRNLLRVKSPGASSRTVGSS
jgi:hypothetical protein